MVTNQLSLEKGVEFIKICFRMRDHSCLTLDEDFYHTAQVILLKLWIFLGWQVKVNNFLLLNEHPQRIF